MASARALAIQVPIAWLITLPSITTAKFTSIYQEYHSLPSAMYLDKKSASSDLDKARLKLESV